MSLVREFLTSTEGRQLRSELELLEHRARGEVLCTARKPDSTLETIRYQMGIADGIGRALNHLDTLAKQG